MSTPYLCDYDIITLYVAFDVLCLRYMYRDFAQNTQEYMEQVTKRSLLGVDVWLPRVRFGFLG